MALGARAAMDGVGRDRRLMASAASGFRRCDNETMRLVARNAAFVRLRTCHCDVLSFLCVAILATGLCWRLGIAVRCVATEAARSCVSRRPRVYKKPRLIGVTLDADLPIGIRRGVRVMTTYAILMRWGSTRNMLESILMALYTGILVGI